MDDGLYCSSLAKFTVTWNGKKFAIGSDFKLFQPKTVLNLILQISIASVLMFHGCPPFFGEQELIVCKAGLTILGVFFYNIKHAYLSKMKGSPTSINQISLSDA